MACAAITLPAAAVGPRQPLPPPSSGTRIQWERRGITLLCAALVEPDSGDEASPPSRALEGVIDKLQTFGGRVEDVTPTSVVAAFGVDPVEDAPRRAAHAAMVIHKRAARAREDKSRTPGSRSASTWRRFSSAARQAGSTSTRRRSARSGRCSIGSCRRIGTDETVASAAAAPFLERRFELVPLDVGAQSVDRPYRFTGQERRGLGLWGAMTKFVGRHDEIEVLRGRVAAAGNGQGQLVAVVGEPGVGKSRLFWEFTHSPHVAGWLVLEAGAVPYGKTTPYLPVIELLKTYCRDRRPR